MPDPQGWLRRSEATPETVCKTRVPSEVDRETGLGTTALSRLPQPSCSPYWCQNLQKQRWDNWSTVTRGYALAKPWGKIHEATVFRSWTAGDSDCEFCLGHFMDSEGKGEEVQAEHDSLTSLTELRQKTSVQDHRRKTVWACVAFLSRGSCTPNPNHLSPSRLPQCLSACGQGRPSHLRAHTWTSCTVHRRNAQNSMWGCPRSSVEDTQVNSTRTSTRWQLEG